MSSLKLAVILAQCRYTKTAQRIFKYSDIQYISLTLDKKLNSLIYTTLFYVNIYGSYTLLKHPTLYITYTRSLWGLSPDRCSHLWWRKSADKHR